MRGVRAFTVTAAIMALLTAAGSAAAADTGMVVLKNGSRIAGEVKGLHLGKLELSTVGMGTIYVEWDKILEINAPEWFEVELSTGARFYGTLGPGPQATLAITLDGRAVNVDLLSVVRIRPIKQSFWSRLDGSIDLGASYTQSSGVGQGSLSVSVRTRRPKFEFQTSFDTTVTVQPDQPETTRIGLSLGYNRLLSNRWFINVIGRAERNTDLGLQLRAAYGAGAGRYLIQTNRSLLGLAGGFSQNREVPLDGDSTNNAEVYAGVTYSFFTYDTPKTNVETSFVVFPSLNVGGRVRTNIDLSLKRELVKDFTFGVTLYDSFDSKPPTEDASKHDLGVTLSIGWIF